MSAVDRRQPRAHRAAVVTGAAHGIGRGVAVRLVRAGWAVVAVDVDESPLRELEESTPSLRAVIGDVAEQLTHEEAAAVARECGRSLAAWVNNAGVPAESVLHETVAADVERILRVNLISAIFGCQQALRSFVEQRVPGAIVNISSIHARGSFPGWAVYDAAKAGVEALTRAVCIEYGHLGVRCNAVAPGAVRTRRTEARLADAADPAAELARIEDQSPMRVLLTPEDVTEAVVFLLSPAARHVNGHILAVDAGLAARHVTLPILPGLDLPRFG